jgi:O-antigen/teichoic acid export membrane protein
MWLFDQPRLFLLIPLAFLNNAGILLSLGICYILSDIFSIWVLRKEIKISFFEIDRKFVEVSLKYSVLSYLSNVLTEAPTLLLPIIVMYFVGREEAAKYYIAMAIGNLTLTVPNALSLSLFVEGSRGQPVKKNIVKVCFSAYLFLIPLFLIFNFWGKNILGLISREYIDSYDLLKFVIAASFFAAICMVYMSVQNINMRVERNIRFSLFRFILLIGASLFLIPGYRIIGVGYAWLLTHIILSLYIAAEFLISNVMKSINRL